MVQATKTRVKRIRYRFEEPEIEQALIYYLGHTIHTPNPPVRATWGFNWWDDGDYIDSDNDGLVIALTMELEEPLGEDQ